MKTLILITVLTTTMLTSASANFSFIGDMIKDMTEAAKDMKTEGMDIAKEVKSEGIDSLKDMKDDASNTTSEIVDKSKELKVEAKQ